VTANSATAIPNGGLWADDQQEIAICVACGGSQVCTSVPRLSYGNLDFGDRLARMHDE